jgi:hypothetical protein
VDKIRRYEFAIVIKAIKSRKMIWAWHVACKGALRNAYKSIVRKRKGRNHLGDLDVRGRKTLNWKKGLRIWTVFPGMWQGVTF